MEKTIVIDGKHIRFKSTGATPLRYKAQFGKDYFSELMKMNTLRNINLESEDADFSSLENVDFEIFYNICWVLAKTADKTIPEPLEWLDGFEEFPMFEILPDLQELIMKSMQSKKKVNHPAMNQ